MIPSPSSAPCPRVASALVRGWHAQVFLSMLFLSMTQRARPRAGGGPAIPRHPQRLSVGGMRCPWVACSGLLEHALSLRLSSLLLSSPLCSSLLFSSLLRPSGRDAIVARGLSPWIAAQFNLSSFFSPPAETVLPISPASRPSPIFLSVAFLITTRRGNVGDGHRFCRHHRDDRGQRVLRRLRERRPLQVRRSPARRQRARRLPSHPPRAMAQTAARVGLGPEQQRAPAVVAFMDHPARLLVPADTQSPS